MRVLETRFEDPTVFEAEWAGGRHRFTLRAAKGPMKRMFDVVENIGILPLMERLTENRWTPRDVRETILAAIEGGHGAAEAIRVQHDVLPPLPLMALVPLAQRCVGQLLVGWPEGTDDGAAA